MILNLERLTRFDNVIYIHNKQHRDRTPKKSQWIISRDAEFGCFENTAALYVNNKFYEKWPATYFGLLIEGNKPQYLGVSASSSNNPRQELFIAKFVDGNSNHKWHGYPADYRTNGKADIPPSKVLNFWHQKKYLSAAEKRKIAKGQRCKLSK